jgi:hypothetical protein
MPRISQLDDIGDVNRSRGIGAAGAKRLFGDQDNGVAAGMPRKPCPPALPHFRKLASNIALYLPRPQDAARFG